MRRGRRGEAMKRKDFIFKKLKEINSPDGISAGELAKRLGLDRANVSRDLNALWREGKVRKQPGRPVRFSASEAPSAGRRVHSASTILDRLAETCDSLRTACEQGKAAVLYPPGGMHMLLLGETGVGKTMPWKWGRWPKALPLSPSIAPITRTIPNCCWDSCSG
ncbi:MAG: helix-turn-helix domain-containing protein [Planifilum fimeticola]